MPQRLLILIILFKSSVVFCFDINQKKFNHISSSDGLSQNRVTSIIKSSNGYYWFGTYNGLNCYDGYDIKIYRSNESDQYSLSSNRIVDIVEDNQGFIWIATLSGLNKFDPRKEKFHRYIDKKNGVDDYYYSIALDGKVLWLALEGGLGRLDIETGKFKIKWKNPGVYKIAVTGDALWLSSSKGLVHYNKSNNTITEYGHPKGDDGTHSTAFILDFAVHNNILWTATKDGIVPFNLKTKLFNNSKHLLANTFVNVLLNDAENLWIGTKGSGLFHYSILNNDLSKVVSSKDDDYQFQSNLIVELFSTENTLWIGHDAGISYTSLKSSVGFLRNSNSGLLDNHVFKIKPDASGGLWIGSGQGVTHYKNDKSKNYKIGEVTGIHSHRSSTLAVGSRGIFEYDQGLKHFNNINSRISFLKGKGDKSIHDILSMGQHIFLLSTLYGVVYWNRETSESYLLNGSEKIVPTGSDGSYGAINFKMNGKDIFLGTYRGLYFVNPETLDINRYLNLPKMTLLDQAEVNEVFIDNKEVLWLSTSKGLFKVKDRKVVKQYTKADGLPDNIIRSAIVVDEMLWVSSDNGLAAFKLHDDHLEKIYLNNKHLKVEYNEAGIYFDSESKFLYFPSMEGVVYFNSNEFKTSYVPPVTNITNVHLFNQVIKPGSNLLPQAIEFTDRMLFKHDQNMLTFEFSSFNINQPDHLYAYQLDGLGNRDDWIFTDADNRRATFTPGPGEYAFRVKSGWDKSTWSDDVAELSIVVLPPWWQTRIAYVFYIVLLLVMLLSYTAMRTSALRKRARELEHMVDDRTQELKSSNQDLQASYKQLNESHEQIEILLERKNTLFANTSHEIRTPLTLILGPINNLLKVCNENQKKDLLLAKRNTERLIHMVDQLLELARVSSPAREEFVNINFSEVLAVIIHSMHSLLKEHDLEFSYKIEENIVVLAIPDAVDIIILNLFSNAIKYTEPGGCINISLSKQDANVVFSVKDTGIGIAKAEQNSIFEKFTRLSDARSRDIPGSGIGLALVKELVDLHHGQINLVSDVEQGSEFTITLPLSTVNVEQAMDIDVLPLKEKKAEVIKSYLSLDQKQKETALDAQTTQGKNPLGDQKPHLLIVDDVQDMLNYLQQLASPYYACMLANNGEEALKYAIEHTPDLIVCDVMMPGIDGFEVLQALRDNIQTSHIPIILLTAKGDKLSRLKGYNAQVDDYIAKPFDADELLARMESLIKNRKKLQEYFSQALSSGQLNLDANDQRLVKKDQEFLSKFQSLIEQHSHQIGYSVTDLVNNMHMSESSLQKKLKAITGCSPLAYLNQYRLQQASVFLKDTDLPIQTIAEKAGFSDIPNFTRLFKKQFGKSPRDYRGR